MSADEALHLWQIMQHHAVAMELLSKGDRWQLPINESADYLPK